MSSGIIDTIKKVALNAFEASNPVQVLFGEVTSTNPVTVQVGEYLTLTKEFLVINGEVFDGDHVTLIRCQGGQKYVVLGTRTGYVENTVYVGGGEDGEETSSGSSRSSGKWQYPYKGKYVMTSGYRTKSRPSHAGVDLVGTASKQLYPVNSGTVVSVVHSNIGYGNNVIVSHGNGIWSLYAHMSKIYVKKDQRVSKNTILGVEGSTGDSTGSHVHLEIRKKMYGSDIDPIAFLNKNK